MQISPLDNIGTCLGGILRFGFKHDFYKKLFHIILCNKKCESKNYFTIIFISNDALNLYNMLFDFIFQ